MTSEQYTSMLQALLPPGMAWPRDPDAVLTALLRAWADEFAREGRRVDDLLGEFIPGQERELVPDWENLLGLSPGSLSIDQRRAAVGSKLCAAGGQSRQYFIGLATLLGYPGTTIDEFRPMSCNGNCNNALASHDDTYVWRVNLAAVGGVFIASCNSDCNSPLSSWGNALIEGFFRQLRAADTDVIFAYV